MNTFIRQTGRNRQKDTDMYREIQLNIKSIIIMHILTEVAQQITNKYMQWNKTLRIQSSLLTTAHHTDEIPERDVTYHLTCLLIYH